MDWNNKVKEMPEELASEIAPLLKRFDVARWQENGRVEFEPHNIGQWTSLRRMRDGTYEFHVCYTMHQSDADAALETAHSTLVEINDWLRMVYTELQGQL